jgi:hypothetical protein
VVEDLAGFRGVGVDRARGVVSAEYGLVVADGDGVVVDVDDGRLRAGDLVDAARARQTAADLQELADPDVA